MFRKLMKVPLSGLITELNLRGFTGFLSLVGHTNLGFVEVDIDFVSGVPTYCSAVINSSNPLEASACFEAVYNIICAECFTEITEVTHEKVRKGHEVPEIFVPVIDQHEENLNFKMASELDDISKALSNPLNLSNLRRFSRTTLIANIPLKTLMKKFIGMAGNYILLLTAEGEGLTIVALARNHQLKGFCININNAWICGKKAITHQQLLKENPVINGVISYVDETQLIGPLKSLLK